MKPPLNSSRSENLSAWTTPCLENKEESAEPIAQSQPVIAQSDAPVLEDGKQSASLESPCVQSQQPTGGPGATAHEVFRVDSGPILENVKMKKELA